MTASQVDELVAFLDPGTAEKVCFAYVFSDPCGCCFDYHVSPHCSRYTRKVSMNVRTVSAFESVSCCCWSTSLLSIFMEERFLWKNQA